MPTRITQIERPTSETPACNDFEENGDQAVTFHPESLISDVATAPTVFKVEGTLYLRDAELLEKICRDV